MWQTEIHIQVDTNSETCALSLWAMLFTSLPVICDAERSHIGMVESESHSVVSDSLWPHGLYNPWNSPGQNSGVDNFSLIQGIFPTRDQTQASYIAGRFSTSWATREALRGDLESAINSCIQTVKSYSNSCQSFPRKMFQSFKCSKEIIYLVVQ